MTSKLQERPVRRSFVMDDPGDLSAEPGSLRWALAMRLQLLITFQERDSAAKHLQVMRDGFKEHEGWRQLLDRHGRPFPSWEAFCQAPSPFGLGTTAEHVDAEVERRATVRAAQYTTGETLPKGRPETNGQFVYLSRSARAVAAGISSNTQKKLDNLARKAPEVMKDLKAGKYRSVHAAEKAAGLVKVETPLEQLLRLWKKTPLKDRREFLRSIKTAR
jgi:hypothetical protein